MTRLDTPAMNLFLAELGQAVAPGAHRIVLMDKAGWHTSGDLVVPENLSLIFLPPYSPELNPIERLWLHLRDNRLSHCVFQTTGEIVDTCCDAWNWLLGQTGRIRSRDRNTGIDIDYVLCTHLHADHGVGTRGFLSGDRPIQSPAVRRSPELAPAAAVAATYTSSPASGWRDGTGHRFRGNKNLGAAIGDDIGDLVR
jgi:hypothetical protein